jgi:hypothetical protein
MSHSRRPAKQPQDRNVPEPGGEPIGLAEIGDESAANAGTEDKIAIPLPVEENDSNAQTI